MGEGYYRHEVHHAEIKDRWIEVTVDTMLTILRLRQIIILLLIIVIIIIIMNTFCIALFPVKNRAQCAQFQMYNR